VDYSDRKGMDGQKKIGKANEKMRKGESKKRAKDQEENKGGWVRGERCAPGPRVALMEGNDIRVVPNDWSVMKMPQCHWY